MNGLSKIASMAAVLLLSACVASEPASRSVSADALTLASRGTGSVPDGVRVVAPLYTVTDVQVTVPQSLRVSEANVFYPMADIVWRGDPMGNRYAQVGAILRDAAAQATASMQGPRAAVVRMELVRFHGVTEKTRYTVGGTHNVDFMLTVLDAATGAPIDGPRLVKAEAKAAGGQAAIAEEQAGRTQKVVVTEKLVQTLRRELSGPVADPAMVTRATGAPVTVALR